MFDKNYIKLGQIYQYLKDHKNHRHKKIENFEILIENDFDVNYQIPINSLVCKRKPDYAGNTALHLVAELYKDDYKAYFDALIKCDTDFTLKNKKGYSPLLLAFDKGITVDSLIIAQFSKNNTNNIRFTTGLSHFHVVCTTDHKEIVDFFIKSGVDVNERVNDDSPKYPGYTPLHFAISNLRLQVTKSLISSGADLKAKDARGITPMHLLVDNLVKHLKLYKDDEQRKILECIALDNLHHLSDDIGLSTFHLSCLLIKFRDLFNKLINQIDDVNQAISLNSPIWPGYTPLHFASHVSLKTVISLLEKGADILAKDAIGTMPLDIILKSSNNMNELVRLLSMEKRHRLSELKLTNGTCLINVMKATVNANAFDQFVLKNFEDKSAFIPLKSPLWPGFNLLHLTVLWGQKYELLSRNTDFTMLDANGMSPLHLAFRMKQSKIVECLLGIYRTVMANPVDRDNLSHLHITCAVGMCFSYSLDMVKRILAAKECDPNVATKCDFEWDFNIDGIPNVIRSGSTPLHIAVSIMNTDLINVLLSAGANPHLPDSTGLTPLQAAISWYNSQIKGTRETDKYLDTLTKMWVIKGNDIMKSDIGTKTFRLALKIFDGKNKLLLLMFKAFDRENRYEELGLTRLQIGSALCDMGVIRHELQAREDVNKQVAFDSDLWPGDTALHILIRQKSIYKNDILQLLLDNGAQLTLENANGSTPILLDEYDEDLHSLIYCQLSIDRQMKLICCKKTNDEGLTHFHKFCTMKCNRLLFDLNRMSRSIKVNAIVDYFADRYYAGYTAFHFLIDLRLPIYLTIDDRIMLSYKRDIVESLFKYGADPKIKTANGLDAMHLAILSNQKFHNEKMVEIILKHPDVKILTTNIFDETILDIISGYYVKSGLQYLEKMLENGYEIDYKDKEGKTALHKFTCSGDYNVVKKLLYMGADINIRDDNGKTAFAYISTEKYTSYMKELYFEHIQQLQDIGMTIDKLNKINYSYYIEDSEVVDTREEIIDEELKNCIHPSFSAKYFFSEKFIVDYKRLPVAQRKAIKKFHLKGFYCQVRWQYRKARFRIRLLEPAEIAFQSLIGWSMPEPCIEAIFQYLSNDDLMNFIRAGNGKLEFAPIPKNY